jgi:hypothetical protein
VEPPSIQDLLARTKPEDEDSVRALTTELVRRGYFGDDEEQQPKFMEAWVKGAVGHRWLALFVKDEEPLLTLVIDFGGDREGIFLDQEGIQKTIAALRGAQGTVATNLAKKQSQVVHPEQKQKGERP